MELQYLFRKPAYPVVALIEGHFVGAKTQKALAGQVARIPYKEEYFKTSKTGGLGEQAYFGNGQHRVGSRTHQTA